MPSLLSSAGGSRCPWLLLGLVPLVAACDAETRGGGGDTGSIDAGVYIDDVALGNDAESEDWLAYGRTYSEQRFSPLDQVNTETVMDLGVAWYMDLPADRGLVSTPLVADGILYFIGSMNRVRAVDAASGEMLWEYDPRVWEVAADRMRAGWEHNRGIALWGDKVYLATWDGRLQALDRENGELVWSTMTVDPDLPLYITGAPKVFKGKVLIGNGGTEIHAARGYVTAYDAETGEEDWRFWIVPGNPADGFENEAMAMAAETWTGEWWEFGGGGNAWHGFTYDPELDQLYIGTGNGSPWDQKVRSPDGGDNLFLTSIVALDPDDGEYLWHYQNTPGETWDFNANMDIVLADLEIEGEARKVLMQAPKNGFFYVIDRTDGSLISAEPYSPVTWATHVDMATGRPVEVPDARYEDGHQIVSPGPAGAHNWHAMSYNPETGLVYIPTIHVNTEFSQEGVDLEAWESPFWRGDMAVSWAIVGSSREDGVTGALQAWDPVRQERVWEIPLDGFWNPGTLTTAGGLVFQGRADGTLWAYDAATGETAWTMDLGLGISAPPVTYSVDGTQYVALLVGWGGGGASGGGEGGWSYGQQMRRLVAFSLDGSVDMPPQPPRVVPEPLKADFAVDESRLALGGDTYERTCGVCHGGGGDAGGMAPDLRASPVVLDAEQFTDILRNGSRAPLGMPRFQGLGDEEIEGIRHYIRWLVENPGGGGSAAAG
ncbi:MAG TPA: PQQ-dependent dehydrogenase, methanol/ethanol family [Longimicrobiales bacterium]|nr:PQQ-dependent dehydrogenase, methanol/ethanol family [Longimicrobiales bacterium]